MSCRFKSVTASKGRTAPGDSAAAAGAAAPSSAGAAAPSSAERELLQSYLDHMVHRMERAARDQGQEPADFAPAAGDLDAAVASGRVESAETAAVLDTLRASYARLDLTFTEPPM